MISYVIRPSVQQKLKLLNPFLKNKMLKLPILHAVLVRSCSDGNKWVNPNAILNVFVMMTIRTTAISCIHFAHFVLFGTQQSKWCLILCVTCFGPTEFVVVWQIFTSCLTECPTLFFNFREVWYSVGFLFLPSIVLRTAFNTRKDGRHVHKIFVNPFFTHVRPVKIQISWHIHADWYGSALVTVWSEIT
jgi:hypothetical protein